MTWYEIPKYSVTYFYGFKKFAILGLEKEICCGLLFLFELSRPRITTKSSPTRVSTCSLLIDYLHCVVVTCDDGDLHIGKLNERKRERGER